MTETTERFLQEIATRVGYDRVAELYLFPVLRQGGVEGAVAVVAAYPEPVAEPPGEREGEHAAAPEEASAPEPGATEVDAQEATGELGEAAEPQSAEPQSAESVDASDASETSATREASEDVEATDAGERAASGESPAPAPHPERARHVVYTARYRHTIKGTDRGRWMVEVVAEADAPLVTVEEVVRGVVRRSGDAFQPERISGDQFRAIVPAPAAPGSAPA